MELSGTLRVVAVRTISSVKHCVRRASIEHLSVWTNTLLREFNKDNQLSREADYPTILESVKLSTKEMVFILESDDAEKTYVSKKALTRF